MSQNREQLQERFHAPHYCQKCNTQPGLDPTWRWNGKAWEHRCQGVHPQAGHWQMEPLDAVALLKERDALQVRKTGYLAFLFRHYALAHVRKNNEQLYNEACQVGMARAEAEQADYQDYVNKVEQERDDLRAQVALLQDAAVKVLEHHRGNVGDTFYPVPKWHIHNLAIACKAVPADAAQYVRGLEDALREIGGNFSCKCSTQQKCQRHIALEALAAKEDRG